MLSNETDNEQFYETEYEPEEMSKTRFNIVVCQRYNKHRHGIATPEVLGHFLVMIRLKYMDPSSCFIDHMNQCINTPTLKYR